MSRQRVVSRLAPWALGACLWAFAAPGSAQDLGTATRHVTEVEGRASSLQSYLRDELGLRNQIPVYTERFAQAELLYRLRDYSRAAVLFTDIVTTYRDSPAYPQSLFLLGESLFLAGDRLGARVRFREVINHASDPFFRPWIQRSLGRLIEIALRTGNVDGIDEIFARLNQIPPSEIEAQTTYIRGKYFFLRANPDYAQARTAFEAVPERAPVFPQARYFLGAILTAQERYPEAIEAFQRVLRIQPEGPEQQQVIDLAALAIGRLQFERRNYDAAIQAYQQVGRSSQFFDRAVFELAWTFIRQGDTVRAERALEVLSVSSPDSPLIPEGRLLWGNVLLRTGRFDRAERVFREVRTEFGVINDQLEQLVTQNTTPDQYFQRLLNSNARIFDAAAFLPPAAAAHVRDDAHLQEALEAIGDLNSCRVYIREIEELLTRLNAAVNSPSRAHVFRDLRRAREQVFMVLNQVTQIRAELAQGLDPSAERVRAGEMPEILLQRRSLDDSVSRLPTSDEAIRRRERNVEEQLNELSQELQRNSVRVDNLEAMVVAIERYMADPRNANRLQNRDQVAQQLVGYRANIVDYRDRITALRGLINAARSQVGVGDPRYERDVELAHHYRDLVRRQVQEMESNALLPAGIRALLARLDSVEDTAEAFDRRVSTVVDRRSETIRADLREEEQNLVRYRERLAQLEAEASDVVGHLVMQSFVNVRQHFYQIVMRADLGLVDVAWEQREEHNNRANELSREQSRQVDALNDEFNEVIEGAQNLDANRPGAAGASGSGGAGGSGSGGAGGGSGASGGAGSTGSPGGSNGGGGSGDGASPGAAGGAGAPAGGAAGGARQGSTP